jgi:hypothetical protein
MKLLGIIAIVAVIAFIAVSCDNGTTTTSSGNTQRPPTEPPTPPVVIPPVDGPWVTHTNHVWGPWTFEDFELEQTADRDGFQSRKCDQNGEEHFLFRPVYAFGQGPFVYEIDGGVASIRRNGDINLSTDIDYEELIIPAFIHNGTRYTAATANAGGTIGKVGEYDYDRSNYIPVVAILGIGDEIWNYATLVLDSPNGKNIVAVGGGTGTKAELVPNATPAQNTARDNIFANATIFTKITFLDSNVVPSNITRIGVGAFSNTGITELILPKSLKTIGSEPKFYPYNSSSATDGPAYGEAVYGEYGDAVTWRQNNTPVGPVTQHGTTPGIGADGWTDPDWLLGAFEDNKLLDIVVIWPGLTHIGANTFKGCGNLVTVDFKLTSTVQRIGNYAFQGCSALSSLVNDLPGSLRFIGIRAFEGATSLNNITISSNVSKILSYAFSGWTATQKIAISGSKPTEGRADADKKFNGDINIWSPSESLTTPFVGPYVLEVLDWNGGAAEVTP